MVDWGRVDAILAETDASIERRRRRLAGEVVEPVMVQLDLHKPFLASVAPVESKPKPKPKPKSKVKVEPKPKVRVEPKPVFGSTEFLTERMMRKGMEYLLVKESSNE